MATAKTAKSVAAVATVTATPAAADVVKQIEDAVAVQKETVVNAEKAVQTVVAAGTDVVKQIEEAVVVHKATIESVVKAGADVASQGVDKAVSLSKEHVEAAVKAGSAAFKGYEDVLQFGQANLDAFVQASSIVARGVQNISQSIVTLAQAQIEESVAASKALLGAKTFQDVVELSSSVAKANFDKLVVESTKLGQLSSKLTEEALAPISGRVEAVVKTLTKHAA
ncbi:MAG TPA: phasin family protein [Patescibacteria group bacterium]|nr:phasin family protein [Patescibacteria group bacterium]